jgi:hypothetical protein
MTGQAYERSGSRHTSRVCARLELWSKDRGGQTVESRWSIGSTGSVLSLWSDGSFLSIGSVGSAVSIGSVGSFASAFSIGSSQSLGSLLSHQSRGSVLSHQSDGSVLSSQATRALKGRRMDGPLPGGTVLTIGTLSAVAVAAHLWYWRSLRKLEAGAG